MGEVLASTSAMCVLRVVLFLEVESPPELFPGRNNTIWQRELSHKVGSAEARSQFIFRSTIRTYRNSFVQKIIVREIRESLLIATLLLPLAMIL